MIPWLKRLRDAFLAWTKANAKAHADSTPHSYCSAPPLGAGGHDPKSGV
ncbi:MAG: hypothetical protein PHD37_16335 [Gallionellaceae bacterium]|nr:hypothetical protein [Gallionellaceae bacterium]